MHSDMNLTRMLYLQGAYTATFKTDSKTLGLNVHENDATCAGAGAQRAVVYSARCVFICCVSVYIQIPHAVYTDSICCMCLYANTCMCVNVHANVATCAGAGAQRAVL
jgi:hypothetical protein